MRGYDDSALKDFLARPRYIKTVNWPHGASMEDDIIVSQLWSTIPTVASKLSNYTLVRGTMCVSVRTNATPFHQGFFTVKWMPNLYDDFGFGSSTLGLTLETAKKIFYSQKPGSPPLDVGESTSYEMKIPFIAPFDYANVVDIPSTIFPWGSVTLKSYTDLFTANGNIVDANLMIFAWMEDIELVVPTVNTVADSAELTSMNVGEVIHQQVESAAKTIAQSQTVQEYFPDQIVSKTTSAIAAAMGAFGTIPVIGPYATVGSAFLNKSASFLSYFGLARPVNVTDLVRTKIITNSSLSHLTGNETTEQLAFDPKQAITVDPGTIGLPNYDQMSIPYMNSRWSAISTATWDPADAFGANKLEVAVYPGIVVSNILSSTDFTSRPFKYWSGSMEYMLVVSSSKYNTGRLSISYAPDGDHLSNPYGLLNMAVIDLGDTKIYKFAIGWSQHVAYKTLDVHGNFTAQGSGIVYNTTAFNGSIRFAVANPLVSPANVPVDFNLFCRGGADLEYAMPEDNYSQLKFWPNTVGDILAPEPYLTNEHFLAGAVDMERTNTKPMVYFGEKVDSFRALAGRYTHYQDYLIATSNGGGQAIKLNLGAFPTPAYDAASNTLGSNVPPRTPDTPFITFASSAFAGWRGSIRWKFSSYGEAPLGALVATRGVNNAPSVAISNLIATGSHITPSDFFPGNAWRGAQLLNSAVAPTLEFGIPFYSDRRFLPTTMIAYNNQPNAVRHDENMGSNITYLSAVDTALFVGGSLFSAGGDDFDLLLYTGGPITNGSLS